MTSPAESQPYYPRGYNPIHEVHSWLKVRNILRAVKRGETIPPYLVDGEYGNGNLLSGTHRAAANDLAELLWGERPIDEASFEDLPDHVRADLMDASDYADVDDILAHHGMDAR